MDYEAWELKLRLWLLSLQIHYTVKYQILCGSKGSTSPLYLHILFSINVKYCFFQKPHMAPAPLQVSPLFVDVSLQKKAVFQKSHRGRREGRGRFIFVFQEEVNNKYSLMWQQHNICSAILRWRNEAEAGFKNSNIKAQDHIKASRCFISNPVCMFLLYISNRIQ